MQTLSCLPFSSRFSKSSILSSMDSIDFSSSSSAWQELYLLQSLESSLYFFRYLYGTWLAFFYLSPFLSDISSPKYSSNPYDFSCLMFRFMAIALILARKLASQMWGCVLGLVTSQSKQTSLAFTFLSFSSVLIFSMSMIRSIWPVVSSLSRSSQLGLMCFWSMRHFSQYWGRYSCFIFSLRKEPLRPKEEVLILMAQAGISTSISCLPSFRISEEINIIRISNSSKQNQYLIFIFKFRLKPFPFPLLLLPKRRNRLIHKLIRYNLNIIRFHSQLQI